ncbi:hypothetical protein AVEN_49343-1 [Araneus ventricosus]|uniref:Uncharacterized protein n=1 Tax=Araneus ventricosus TaxID=182803 RepID=A0A4Y2LTJ4_ARAVE|nr:hypothetical protein AVEN_49343-1 [Araneus ventricosus]
MQNFFNACAKNCGWETRSDSDYRTFFDSYDNLLIEFYKAPFSTPGGLFLDKELKVLRQLLRGFENNEIRRALRRFIGTIDRHVLQKYECVRALYDKFSNRGPSTSSPVKTDGVLNLDPPPQDFNDKDPDGPEIEKDIRITSSLSLKLISHGELP